MQAVAERLGVTPMALYRHVDNKGDLLDGVVESLLDEMPTPSDDTPVGTSSCRRWGVPCAPWHDGTRRSFLCCWRYPRARRVRCVPVRGYEALRAGVGEADVERVERLISTMVLGFAASEASGRFRSHSRKVLDADYAALEHMVRVGLRSYVERGAADAAPK